MRKRKGNLSVFLDFISNFIVNSTADSIILAIIGIIAFLVAFGFVGMIFDALGFYDSNIMSDTHWIVRIIVFLGLLFICIEIAKFIKWLFSFQWWIYLIAGLILIGIIILYRSYRFDTNCVRPFFFADRNIYPFRQNTLESCRRVKRHF